MAYRLYITPQIGIGRVGDFRRPKYFDGLRFSGMDYGFQPIFLVAADLTPAQDAAITTNADVDALPFDLTPAVGGSGAQAARDALEAAFIPAQWVNANTLWSEVARVVAAMFQFMQRLNVYLGNQVLIDSSAKMNVQWSAIPAVPYQQAIVATAQSLNYVFNPAPQDQLRKLLKDMADQWGDRPFQLGEFVF